MAAHPQTTDYLIDRQRSPSLQSHGHPLCSVARPVFISRPWVLDALDESQPLIAALRHDAVCMVNSFRAELMANKALFALPTDPDLELGLTASQRAAVDAHVP